MRIALCANGESPHAQRWANGLAAGGHALTLVWATDRLESADLSAFDASIDHRALVTTTDLGRPWKSAAVGRAAHRLAEQLRPDVAHGIYLYGPGWIAHALGVRPLVLTALGSDVRLLRRSSSGSPKERLGDAYRVHRTRAAVSAADVVLADSAAIAEVVREDVPGTVTRIVRFGVEPTSPSPAARSVWRRRLNVGDDAFVLFSSRLVRPLYNIDTIVRAFAAARERVPGAVLVLKELPRLTDPDYRRFCLELVAELGLADSVRTLGELDRDELRDLHASADVYLSVPSSDGTAVSIFEAMAAGAAVVAADVPGLDPEILRNGETALLVPPRDAESLASAIVTLAQNEGLRLRLVERGREIVKEFGDFDRELARAVRLYEELAGARSGARSSGRSPPASG